MSATFARLYLIQFTIVSSFCILNCRTVALAEDASASADYTGTFADDQLAITLTPGPTADSYIGVIQRGDAKFKCTARLANRILQGDFVDTSGNNFPFTASMDGHALLFTTANTTHKLAAHKVDAIQPARRKTVSSRH